MIGAIIGAGGVGQAIASRLFELGHEVYLVHRPHQVVKEGIIGLTDWRALPWEKLQVVLLCVRDSQIAPLAREIAQVADQKVAIGHTAGSVSIDALGNSSLKGVIYPLQTFSQGAPIQWGYFPVFWEGDRLFFELATILSGNPDKIYEASSPERLRLHIGAVFVANFTNAMVDMAHRVIQPKWDYTIYLPLLEAVVQKLYYLSPREAQTGPARRGDRETIQKHLALLKAEWPELVGLYEAMSRHIQSQSLQ
mgnify:CR=1 FL=1